MFAITQAVAAFVSEFESMWGDGKTSPQYVVERCWNCARNCPFWPDIKTVAGPATVKLLDALAAYRVSELTTAKAALGVATLEVPASS